MTGHVILYCQKEISKYLRLIEGAFQNKQEIRGLNIKTLLVKDFRNPKVNKTKVSINELNWK